MSHASGAATTLTCGAFFPRSFPDQKDLAFVLAVTVPSSAAFSMTGILPGLRFPGMSRSLFTTFAVLFVSIRSADGHELALPDLRHAADMAMSAFRANYSAKQFTAACASPTAPGVREPTIANSSMSCPRFLDWVFQQLGAVTKVDGKPLGIASTRGGVWRFEVRSALCFERGGQEVQETVSLTSADGRTVRIESYSLRFTPRLNP